MRKFAPPVHHSEEDPILVSDNCATQSENQATQEQMVEQAKNIPGVAEAAAVHDKLAPYANVTLAQQYVRIGYATGGNA